MSGRAIFKENAKIVGSFVQGFYSVFNVFKRLSGKKGYKKYFILPFMLNVIVLGSIVYFSFTTLDPIISDLLKGDSTIFSILRVIIRPFLFLILAFISIFLYSIIGNIITAPFNDLLSEKVENLISGETFDEKFSISLIIQDMIRIVSNIIRLLLLVVIINLFLLFLNLIPVVGQILYSILSFMVTGFFFGFQFFDFPLERRRYVFKEKLSIAWKFKFMIVGLGTGFFLISLIPIVGFLSLNLGAAAATILFIDHVKPHLSQQD